MDKQQTQTPQPTPTQDTTSSDTFQKWIPTQNKPALIGYYMGIAGLLPFIGIVFAIAAVILGIMGLKQFGKNPTPGAKGHAITAIVLGAFEILCFAAFTLLLLSA